MTTKRTKKATGWHVALWIAQVLLAGMFLMVGFMKTFTPIAELAPMIPMAGEMPILTRFIGISELAGGIGLLLPAALRLWPGLTTLAAALLGVVMVLALIYHLSRAEYDGIGMNIGLGLLATFIVWGRLTKAPITPRSGNLESIAR